MKVVLSVYAMTRSCVSTLACVCVPSPMWFCVIQSATPHTTTHMQSILSSEKPIQLLNLNPKFRNLWTMLVLIRSDCGQRLNPCPMQDCMIKKRKTDKEKQLIMVMSIHHASSTRGMEEGLPFYHPSFSCIRFCLTGTARKQLTSPSARSEAWDIVLEDRSP